MTTTAMSSAVPTATPTAAGLPDPTAAAPLDDLEDFRRQAGEFRRAFDSVMLATVSPDGTPQASYAVCFNDGRGHCYIYVSELSAHTANLAANGRASLMLIEDESQARHLFARRRLTWHAQAVEIARGSAEFESLMDAFETRYGAFMRNLRNLADFHLFQLSLGSGNFVAGFARAFEFEGADFDGFRHMNDVGHRRTRSEDAA